MSDETVLFHAFRQSFGSTAFKFDWSVESFVDNLRFIVSVFDGGVLESGIPYYRAHRLLADSWSYQLPLMSDDEFLYVFPRLLAVAVWAHPGRADIISRLLDHLDLDGVEDWLAMLEIDDPRAQEIVRNSKAGRINLFNDDQLRTLIWWIQYVYCLCTEEEEPGTAEIAVRADAALGRILSHRMNG